MPGQGIDQLSQEHLSEHAHPERRYHRRLAIYQTLFSRRRTCSLDFKEIINLITQGARVFYITGNHDEMLRRYTDIQMGNFTLTDKLVLEIDNKMTWIFHGDVFDNTTKGSARILAKLGSRGYQLLIRFNRFINFVLNLLGQERVSISKRVMHGVNKAVSKVNDSRIDRRRSWPSGKKYDYVI